jgi:Fe-S oxidoreductase
LINRALITAAAPEYIEIHFGRFEVESALKTRKNSAKKQIQPKHCCGGATKFAIQDIATSKLVSKLDWWDAK